MTMNEAEEGHQEGEAGAEEDLGQSPVLSQKGERSKFEGRVASPESLRDDDEEGEMVDAIEFTGLNRAGERVVLTADQMRGISALMSRCVKPGQKKENKSFDSLAFLKSIQASDPGSRIIKVRRSDFYHHQEFEEQEEEEHSEEEKEEAGDQDEEEISGREMWSTDESEDVETEVMPDVTVSSEAGWSQSSLGSSVKSPRAELSSHDGCIFSAFVDDVNVRKEEADSSPRSPAAKRMRWTEEEEKLSNSPLIREWTPVLSKMEDGRQPVTISTSSGSSMETGPDTMRVTRSMMTAEGPVWERQVRYPDDGKATFIPDNDVVENVFYELFGGAIGEEEEVKDEAEDEDEN